MIPYGRQTIEEDDIQAVVDVLKSDFLTTGPKIAEFEKGLYEFVETKYPEIYKAIRETGEINSETDVLIQKAITEFKNQF